MYLTYSREYYKNELLSLKKRYEIEMNKDKPSISLIGALFREMAHYEWCMENSK